jgi:tetratricopeptide (TPR) repeat protein
MGAFWFKPTNSLVAAVAAFEAGDFEEAEWLLMQVGDEDKEAYQTALFYRSRIYCARDLHDDAQRMLERAIGALPQAYLFYHLGACIQHQERWSASEGPLARAVALDPRQTDAWILLGMALRNLGRNDEALRAFERSLVNDPRAKLARYLLAQVCIDRKDYTRALAQLHVLGQQEPDYSPMHKLMAEIHLALGDKRQALVELCWLTDRGFGDVWCMTEMGRSFEAIGEKVQALVAFEKAMRLDPDLPDVMAASAKLNEELERFGSSLALYRALEREDGWADRARNGIDRLERKVKFCRLMNKPEDQDIVFAGFRPPKVAEKPATAPIPPDFGQRTAPFQARARTAPVFGEGRVPSSMAYGQGSKKVEEAAAAPRGEEPLAMKLARNVASLTKEVAGDPTNLFKNGKDQLIDSAIGFLGKLKGK